jgi:hypothetical protein
LLNAAGYTRRWNPTEFSGNPHPFKYFDGKLIPPGLGALCDSTVNPYRNFYTHSERRYFGAGEAMVDHYHVSFPPGPNVFAYAVDASWDEPVIPSDIFYTEFAPDDPLGFKWSRVSGDFAMTSYWQCDFFQNQVNSRDETCLSYGALGESAILVSPPFKVPNNVNDMTLYVTHSISMDLSNELDLACMFISPAFNLDNAIQLRCDAHPYEVICDPYKCYDWWKDDYLPAATDAFDLTGPLKSLQSQQYRIMFAFATDGDDATGGEGWTIYDMRIEDLNAQPIDIPGAFPMTANMIEPYNIELVDSSGMLECSLGKYAGGSVNLSIAVDDWQGGATVPLDKVTLEAPDLFEGVAHPTSSLSTAEGDLCFYEITVPNDLVAEPGFYPGLLAVEVPDTDPVYVEGEPLTAYQMFTFEVEEVAPPFCMTQTAIHGVHTGSHFISNSPGALHLDCCFLPLEVSAPGGLLFDGGIQGSTELIQAADIDADGGPVTAVTVIERPSSLAGNSLAVEGNEHNGHLLIVTDKDADNLLVYKANGQLLKEYDLLDGEDGRNEPVCLVSNPSNGDIWFVGHKGSWGVDLEHWAYAVSPPTFEYVYDPLAKIDLLPYLGPSPKPLGMAINTDYNYLYIFHAQYNGTVDVFDLSQIPPVYLGGWSRSNIIGQPIETTAVTGLRKVIGGDIRIDHTDGEAAAECRVLVFANTLGGGSTLVKLDTWCQELVSVPLSGGPYSCMALSNLPDPNNRPLVFFPTASSTTYSLYLGPNGW